MATRSALSARRPTTLYEPGASTGRGYMVSAYAHMAVAVAISAATAVLAGLDHAISRNLFTSEGLTLAGWIVTLAPVAFAIALNTGVERLSARAARLLFDVYAALVGLSLGSVFLAYAGQSVGIVFIAAVAGFAGLAALGSIARRDLGPSGSFLTVALFGLVTVMLINLFVGSASLDVATAALGILVFAGLTAFDAQKLRSLRDRRPQAAVIGAFALYLDFINLFLSLLRLVGRPRR